MKRRMTLGSFVLLGLSLLGGACSSNDGYPTGENTSAQDVAPSIPPSETPPPASSSAGAIDVASSSRLSLSLRGSLGPIIEGQTITKAMVTLQDVELASDSGAAFPLMTGSVTADLLSLQDSLQELVQGQTVEAGRFTNLRFHLVSAWIETTDAENTTHVFATDRVDRSQFSSVASVGTLQLGGIGSDGFVSVALPQSGISVQGTASLALHFSLTESLSVQSSDVWVLQPRVWAVDESVFSSVDVQFEVTSEYSEYFSQGFQVMLFDANLRPVCEAPLTATSSTLFAASFQYIESYEGPFVAVLVPPSGVSLQSAVAVSIDVRQSVRVEARVSVTSVQRVSGTTGAGTLDVRTSDRADITQRTSEGQVVAQTRQPVGPIEQVAPRTRPQEPLRPGEQPLAQAPAPRIPGLPPPHNAPADGGAPPPFADAGEGRPPLADAGGPPVQDAGERPPGYDAGGVPPGQRGGPRQPPDAGRQQPPAADAGGPPSRPDAGPQVPTFDAGAPPVMTGPVGQPPEVDAGAPSSRPGVGSQPSIPDAGAPRQPATPGMRQPPASAPTAGGPPPAPSGGTRGPSSSPSGGTRGPSTPSAGRQGPTVDAGAAPPAKRSGRSASASSESD